MTGVTRKQYREHKARMDEHFARVDEDLRQSRVRQEEQSERLARHTNALVLMLDRSNEIVTISAEQRGEWRAESEAHRAALWAMIDRLGGGGPPPASTG